MYKFKINTLENIDIKEYEVYENKDLFTTVNWLNFLKKFRHVKPYIITIMDVDGKILGHFTGALLIKFGLRIFGSPFYGWMGQHMGFDFINIEKINKSVIIDEIFEFIKKELKLLFIILIDFKFEKNDYTSCKTKFFYDETRETYFLDLTHSEEELFKNFKSGYRTCVRKFEKMGGAIEIDNSDAFIEEHHKQLKDVFARKGMTSPDYRKRMSILLHDYPDLILFIKALDENGKNIASSYYIGGGNLCFFASNASYTESLNYCANQALMWYAIKYWKSKGMKIMDLAGRASYKENFGASLYGTPIIIWSKYYLLFKLIILLRNLYYKSFQIKGKIFNICSKK